MAKVKFDLGRCVWWCGVVWRHMKHRLWPYRYDAFERESACVCECVREHVYVRERESVCVCECMCLCERVHMCVCICACSHPDKSDLQWPRNIAEENSPELDRDLTDVTTMLQISWGE